MNTPTPYPNLACLCHTPISGCPFPNHPPQPPKEPVKRDVGKHKYALSLIGKWISSNTRFGLFYVAYSRSTLSEIWCPEDVPSVFLGLTKGPNSNSLSPKSIFKSPSLVGRLSQETSHETTTGTILMAYTTPSGLALIMPSLSLLPLPTPACCLVFQVPTLSSLGENFTLSPSLSPFGALWSIFPENTAAIISSTPQQAADFATIAYEVNHTHVVHFFDHDSSREIGHIITPLHIAEKPTLTLHEAFRETGYTFFEYHGKSAASVIIVLQNGPLALQLKQAINVMTLAYC